MEVGTRILLKLHTLFYISKLLFPKNPLVQKSLNQLMLCFTVGKLKNLSLQSLKFRLFPQPRKVIESLISNAFEYKSKFDIDRILVLRVPFWRKIPTILKSYHKKWISVQNSYDKKFYAQLIITTATAQELQPSQNQFLYSSSGALRNAKQMFKTIHILPTISIEVVTGSKICLSPVNSGVSIGSNKSLIQEQILDYFEQEKILSVGNILTIFGNKLIVKRIEPQDPLQREAVYSVSNNSTTFELQVFPTSNASLELEYWEPYLDIESQNLVSVPSIPNCLHEIAMGAAAAETNQLKILLRGNNLETSLVSCQIAGLLGVPCISVNVGSWTGDTGAYTEGKIKVLEKALEFLSLELGHHIRVLLILRQVQFLGKTKEGNVDRRLVLAFQNFMEHVGNRYGNGVDSFVAGVIGICPSPENQGEDNQSEFCIPLAISLCFPTELDLDELEPARRGDLSSNFNWLLVKSQGNHEISDSGMEFLNKFKLNPTQFNNIEDSQLLFELSLRKAAENSDIDFQSLEIQFAHFESGLMDFKQLQKIMARSSSSSSEVEIPHVSWKDVGGLGELKQEICTSLLQFQKSNSKEHLHGSGKRGVGASRRSGILLHGPPGTGKTFLARAVASEMGFNFLSVKGPELLNMYIGQSEQNIRRVFQKARNAGPSILFFDELDSLAPARGRSGDSGGVMDRVVSQLLAELDSSSSTPQAGGKGQVFVLGATNRPDLIDTALLRPGRFEKLLYVGHPTDSQSKTHILQAVTRKFPLDPDVNLAEIGSLLPGGMSGADISFYCKNVYMNGVRKLVSSVSEKQMDQNELKLILSNADFRDGISEVIISSGSSSPSKSQSEI